MNLDREVKVIQDVEEHSGWGLKFCTKRRRVLERMQERIQAHTKVKVTGKFIREVQCSTARHLVSSQRQRMWEMERDWERLRETMRGTDNERNHERAWGTIRGGQREGLRRTPSVPGIQLYVLLTFYEFQFKDFTHFSLMVWVCERHGYAAWKMWVNSLLAIPVGILLCSVSFLWSGSSTCRLQFNIQSIYVVLMPLLHIKRNNQFRENPIFLAWATFCRAIH